MKTLIMAALIIGLFVSMGATGAMAVSDFWPYYCEGEVFSDVNAQAMPVPVCGAIEELERLSVAIGCAGDRFCPDAPLTRAQFAVLLVQMMSSYYDADAVAKRIFNLRMQIEQLEARIAELEARR